MPVIFPFLWSPPASPSTSPCDKQSEDLFLRACPSLDGEIFSPLKNCLSSARSRVLFYPSSGQVHPLLFFSKACSGLYLYLSSVFVALLDQLGPPSLVFLHRSPPPAFGYSGGGPPLLLPLSPILLLLPSPPLELISIAFPNPPALCIFLAIRLPGLLPFVLVFPFILLLFRFHYGDVHFPPHPSIWITKSSLRRLFFFAL